MHFNRRSFFVQQLQWWLFILRWDLFKMCRFMPNLDLMYQIALLMKIHYIYKNYYHHSCNYVTSFKCFHENIEQCQSLCLTYEVSTTTCKSCISHKYAVIGECFDCNDSCESCFNNKTYCIKRPSNQYHWPMISIMLWWSRKWFLK